MYSPDSVSQKNLLMTRRSKIHFAYADANKDNKELIMSISEKAQKLKGISHREASVLLACEDKELIQKVFDLAIKIQGRILWKSYRYVCSIISCKLLCQRMYLLSLIIIRIQHIRRRNLNSGRDQERSYRSSGYGA